MKYLINRVKTTPCPFQNMLRTVTSSSYYNRMRRFTAPLKDFLGINHFWYYRITNNGDYTYLGSHVDWSEYCFAQDMLSFFPCLRHPSTFQDGISLMKAGAESAFQMVLQTAWEKFQVNLNINILKKVSSGVEAFGFGSCFNDPKADERILNQLPILKVFTQAFKENNQKLFSLLEENQVNLPSWFGSTFYERPKEISFPSSHEKFLMAIGCGDFLSLSKREQAVVTFIAEGYPAPYVAQQLALSHRTVENYIVSIKTKLNCHSKIELMQKTKQIKESLEILNATC